MPGAVNQTPACTAYIWPPGTWISGAEALAT